MLYKNPHLTFMIRKRRLYEIRKRKERKKHHGTQFSNKSNSRGGVKVSQTESCVYHSEANVTSSEGSLLLFQRSSAQRRYRGTTTILSHKKKKKKNG